MHHSNPCAGASSMSRWTVSLSVGTLVLCLAGQVLLAKDYPGLINLDSKTSVTCGRYNYDRASKEFRATATIKNTSSEPIRTPLVLAFSNLPAGVTLRNDGSLPDGTGYADFTDKVPGGILQPGASTDSRVVAFAAPQGVRLSPTMSVWGEPPVGVTASASPTTGPVPLAVVFSATGTGNVVKYEWDFDGDGTYDWQSPTTGNTSHTYATVGTFNATVRVTDNGGWTATHTVPISPLPGLKARPGASPTSGPAPLNVNFTTGGYDPVGTIQIFRWDFDGNGSWDTYDTVARDYTHTYSHSGTYHPALYVQSSTGDTDTNSVTITVSNSPPTAKADVNPSNGAVPLVVQLTGTGTDPDGSIVLYEWDFDGDGTFDWSSTTTGTTSHTYTAEGTYHAVFRVTDNEGAAATATAITTAVRVGPTGSPTATASANPTSGPAPLTVNFDGTATDPDNKIVKYEWDFDNDGTFDWSSTTSAATSHTYTEAGTHVAAFRVTDETGLTGVDYITISVDLTTTLSIENNTVGILGAQAFINYCRLGGVVANASTYYDYYGNYVPANGVDGQSETYWYSEPGDNPSYVPPPDPYPGDTYIEVTFPSPQTVSQINLNGGSWWGYYGITRGRIDLFDAANAVLYSHEIDIGSSYVEILIPETANVTRCRLTALAANMSYEVCTVGEFEVGLAPAQPSGQFANHCLLAGVVANASSVYDGTSYPATNAIDGNPETYWASAYQDTPAYTYTPTPKHGGDTFFEVIFPSPKSVAQVNINGGSYWPNYGITRGRIELFDAADNLLYSQEVDIGSAYAKFKIAEVKNVTRCRLTAIAAYVDSSLPVCSLGELEVGRVPEASSEAQGTNIITSISADTRVSLYINDALGKKIRTLVDNQARTLGTHSDFWDCNDDGGFVANDGLYYAILRYQLEGTWHELDLTHSTGGTRYQFPFGTGADTRDSFQNGYTFSPFNDDFMPMTFRLSKAQEVTAFMGPLWSGSDQDRIRTIVNRQPFPAGKSSIYWDGLDDQGNVAQPPSGDLLITGFWRYDLPDNAMLMTGGTPSITDVNAIDNYYSPFSEKCDANGVGEGITLAFTLSEDVERVELRVYGVTNSALLRTIVVNSLTAGEHSIYWDGKNNNGEYVDIGDYRLGVIAKDAEGNESMLRYTLVRFDY